MIFVWLLVGMLCVHSTIQLETNEGNLSDHKLSGMIQWRYEKRPFCNAFTGCGKKRTSYPQRYPILKRNNVEEMPSNNEYMGEDLSDLIDINAEPAVESVQKQIMSQAKLFEAIKEASKELYRQKQNKQRYQQLQQEHHQQEQQPLPLPIPIDHIAPRSQMHFDLPANGNELQLQQLQQMPHFLDPNNEDDQKIEEDQEQLRNLQQSHQNFRAKKFYGNSHKPIDNY